MPGFIITKNIQVFTKERDWQFPHRLLLTDEILCAIMLRDNSMKPEIVWCPIRRLGRTEACYMQFLNSKNFNLTYSDAHVLVTSQGKLLTLTSEYDEEWRTCSDSTVDMSVFDENLDPIVLNSEENLEYFHNREHKVWSTVYSIAMDQRISVPRTNENGVMKDVIEELYGDKWICSPLLRQGGPLFDCDPFDATSQCAVYALDSNNCK